MTKKIKLNPWQIAALQKAVEQADAHNIFDRRSFAVVRKLMENAAEIEITPFAAQTEGR